jgi:hypothetical protein
MGHQCATCRTHSTVLKRCPKGIAHVWLLVVCSLYAMKHFYSFASALFLICLSACSLRAQTNSIYTLHPQPKTSFERTAGAFVINDSTPIVFSDFPSSVSLRAVDYLEEHLSKSLGFTLVKYLSNVPRGGQPAIYLGDVRSNPELAAKLTHQLPAGETVPDSSGGYVLDVTPQAIVLCGGNYDGEGAFNAVATLVQLMNVSGATATVRAAHIWDFPDYTVRGLWSMHNLLVPTQLHALEGLEDIMASHKMNTVMQSDFKLGVLDIVPSFYFPNVDSFKTYSQTRKIDIVPSVAPVGYAESIFIHDPNLAEGFPTLARYQMQSDSGLLVTDPAMIIPNSGFEDHTGQHFNGWAFYDGEGSFTTFDNTIFHSGSTSAKCVDATNNCRFCRTVQSKPMHHYILSAWIKTSSFNGSLQLLAIGFDDSNHSRVLTSTQFSSHANTNGWMQVQVGFNSLQFPHVNCYVGAWGGFKGTIWFDDFEIREVGMQNVLRRAGTPLWVRHATTGKVYREGIDFDTIRDQVMLANNGNYPVDHAAPTIHLKLGSAIKNGDLLDVSYYHPLSTQSDEVGGGQAAACLSDDSVFAVVHDQDRRVEALYHPKSWFMQHDEIRVIGWDSSCVNQHKTSAQIMSDNARRIAGDIETMHPGADVWVWSDMFDTLHNAVNNYYLVKDDLTGDWNSLPNTITIVNWNGAYRSQSLKFFSDKGFKQITSPYYDAGNTVGMRDWRKAQETMPGIRGMMYTTWQQDYSYLTQFADYAWGIAPYIYHTPIDSSALIALHGQTGSIKVFAVILPDAYDGADKITSAAIIYSPPHGAIKQIPMVRDTGNSYVGTITAGGPFQYSITALDANGIQRSTPTYIVSDVPSVVSTTVSIVSELLAFPNPTHGSTTLRLPSNNTEWQVSLFDALGRTVATFTSRVSHSTLPLDLTSYASGAYRLVASGGGRTYSTRISIVH